MDHPGSERTALYNEIAEWKEKKRSLEQKVASLKSVRNEKQTALSSYRKSLRDFEDLFKLCAGVEVVTQSENEIFLRFHPMYQGKKCYTYSLQLSKITNSWAVTFCDMPYLSNNIFQELKERKVCTISELWSFIFLVWHQIVLFVQRQELFQEAQGALKQCVFIYPSIDTLRTAVCLTARDAKQRSKIRMTVTLNYDPHKILPEKPSIKFEGASSESEELFTKDLEILQYYPLKEALCRALSLENSSDLEEQSSQSSSKDESLTKERDSSKDETLVGNNKERGPTYEKRIYAGKEVSGPRTGKPSNKKFYNRFNNCGQSVGKNRKRRKF